VYDVKERRVVKALKKCREYLNWVQNSVFEGEISDANLVKLKHELKKILNEKEDSVIIYNLRTLKYFERQILGVERQGIGNIL
jgi:CRISPR-associated protein Cas2